eukprot:4010252-Prymnesium_polylepis.1
MDFDVEGDRRVRCKASSAAVYGRVPSFLSLSGASLYFWKPKRKNSSLRRMANRFLVASIVAN